MSATSRAGFWRRLRRHAAYPVLYMFAASCAASGLLVGLSRATQARVKANEQVLLEKAVLLAVGAGLADSAPPQTIHATFREVIREPTDATAGAYVFLRDGRVAAYAIPLAGQGFWNMIRGMIGVSPDGATLTGLAFYEQNETPGLGAEIVKPSFRERFKGVRLADGARPIALKPVGALLGDHDVQAITGATQTCTRLEDIVNRALSAWRSRRPGGLAADRGGAS